MELVPYTYAPCGILLGHVMGNVCVTHMQARTHTVKLYSLSIKLPGLRAESAAVQLSQDQEIKYKECTSTRVGYLKCIEAIL